MFLVFAGWRKHKRGKGSGTRGPTQRRVLVKLSLQRRSPNRTMLEKHQLRSWRLLYMITTGPIEHMHSMCYGGLDLVTLLRRAGSDGRLLRGSVRTRRVSSEPAHRLRARIVLTVTVGVPRTLPLQILRTLATLAPKVRRTVCDVARSITVR